MNILKLLFELFVIYILYKFIFDLVIPVYKATQQVKQKMNSRQQQARQHEPPQNDPYQNGKKQQATAFKPADDDYIDYEEIK